MIKLDLPVQCQNYEKLIDSCNNSIQIDNYEIKPKLLNDKKTLLCFARIYKKLANRNKLFRLNKFILKNEDDAIFNNCKLTRRNMTYLYKNIFCGKKIEGFYDLILNYAKDPMIQCPFCGGLNEPTEIDHFLPKSLHAQYTIFPYNLIPICKDCNQIYKRNFYPKNEQAQLIHPYLDEDCYFNEKWLYANCKFDNNFKINDIEFYISPPVNWDEAKKNKIKFHFNKFDLNRRFSEEAFRESVWLNNYIHDANLNFLETLCNGVITNENFSINYWKIAFYRAIKDALIKKY